MDEKGMGVPVTHDITGNPLAIFPAGSRTRLGAPPLTNHATSGRSCRWKSGLQEGVRSLLSAAT